MCTYSMSQALTIRTVAVHFWMLLCNIKPLIQEYSSILTSLSELPQDPNTPSYGPWVVDCVERCFPSAHAWVLKVFDVALVGHGTKTAHMNELCIFTFNGGKLLPVCWAYANVCS
ncbi:hypothetical protein J3R30DRAFT_3679118 [Lentinula aciculospora]|uniref:Uncharacterized protein n=1 Tax=Lentinula aciculospora TaxID=153920 RepID=A0A9W9DXA6_9AGAR|nr:hypothetical protein J3R30DRAFT_3679118 [Lentinula aciculospora]